MSAQCGGTVPAPLRPGQFRGANVLLVTIDTLRADRVGAYGNASHLTPALDRLAARGVTFTHAYSHVPMTLPAHTSILTGLIPPHTGVRNNTTFRLDDRVPTLATFLKRAGYRTGAFVGAFVLDMRFGLSRDFDRYDDRLPRTDRAAFRASERRAEEVIQAASNWIVEPSVPSVPSVPSPESRSPSPEPPAPSPPWFAWIHLFDPHAPYQAPPEYRANRAPYDAEVAYTDAALGRLLDRLRDAQLLDRTLIVVTADHGESLGEHGETTHGLFAYQSTIAVPLMFSGAGLAAVRVDAPAAHADIVPTVLDLVGAAPPNGVDGQSLAMTPDRRRPIYFEALDAALTRGWAPLRGVIVDRAKYIDLPEAELYDLASDPGESRNQAGRSASAADSLRTALTAIESSGQKSATASAIDAEAAGRLRALGYVGGSPGVRGGPALSDDPKRLAELNERFNSALTAFDEGRRSDALAAFLSILQTRPDFFSARTSAATVLIGQGRAADAVRLLREAPHAQQQSAIWLAKLGAALRDAGDLRDAMTTLEEARAKDPNDPSIDEDLAVVYAGLGRTEQARPLFRAIVTKNPGSASGWYNLGLLELQSGNAPAAADALAHAVADDASYGDAWQALGAALIKTEPKRAIDAWRRAERLLPHDYDLLFNLGMVLAESERPRDAVPYLERFARDAPPQRYARDIRTVRERLVKLRGGQGQ